MMLAIGTLLLAASMLPTAHAADAGKLKVCADPNYLPYSNHDGKGFENDVAQFVAHKLGATLDYTGPNPAATAAFPNTFRATSTVAAATW